MDGLISAEADAEAEHQRQLSKNRQAKRRSTASTLELYFYVLALSYIIWRQMRGNPRLSDIEYLITQPSFLIVSGLLVFSIFSMILASTTPFVAALSGDLKIGNASFSFPVRIAINNNYESPNGENGYINSQSEAQFDVISNNFLRYIGRSDREMQSARKRPNALLFAGFFVAISGLGFFILTLPSATPDAPTGDVNMAHYFWSTGLQFLPRLLMLIFIQVLAGFFLRQYRTSMEDYRYFEAVLRVREAQYLSYLVLKEASDRKAILQFAQKLNEPREVGVLAKGETTAALESLRSETNELLGLTAQMTSAVTQAKRKASVIPKEK